MAGLISVTDSFTIVIFMILYLSVNVTSSLSEWQIVRNLTERRVNNKLIYSKRT